jgi:hypothetical protein
MHPEAGCARLDSLLLESGLAAGIHMEGKATIDVEQYRVRGRFALRLSPGGDLTFEITSTTMLGGRREDAVLSFYADTLRVLDREGGSYYEGEDAGAFVAEGLGHPIDLAELLRRATGRAPDCRRVSGVGHRRARGGVEVVGRIDGEDFRLEFVGPRLARAFWPLPLAGRRARDTMEARYQWRGEALAELVLYVPERRWRIKLSAE